MKALIIIAAVIIICLIFLYLISKREIYTEVEIDASAETVWNELGTFEEYPNWNPFIRNISGDKHKGSKLNVSIQPGNGKAMDIEPTLLKVEELKEIRWLGQLLIAGIFDGEHVFKIQEINETRVKFIQSEKYAGILVPIVWTGMEPGIKQGFQAMNKALKEIAESGNKETATLTK